MDEVVGMVGMLFPAFFILAGAVLLIAAPIVDHKHSVARKREQYEDAEERKYLIS